MHRMLRAGLVAVALALIPAADAAAAPYASRTLAGRARSGSDVKALQRYLDRGRLRHHRRRRVRPGHCRQRARLRGRRASAPGRPRHALRAAPAAGTGERPPPPRRRSLDGRHRNPHQHGRRRLRERQRAWPSRRTRRPRRSSRSSRPATRSPASPTATAAATDAGATAAMTAPAPSPSRSTARACSARRSTRPASCAGATRGRGEWVSIYANAGHAYMVVAGLRFDTSSSKRVRQPLDRNDAVVTRLPRPASGGTLMALVALLALMLGSFAGLLIGRWAAALPLAAAALAAAVLAGPEAGAVGALASAGLLAGVHLHRVVAE